MAIRSRRFLLQASGIALAATLAASLPAIDHHAVAAQNGDVASAPATLPDFGMATQSGHHMTNPSVYHRWPGP